MKSSSIQRLTALMLVLLLVAVSAPVGVHADVAGGHAAMGTDDCSETDQQISHASHCCLVQIPLASSQPLFSQPIDYGLEVTIEPEERQAGTLPDPLFRPPRRIG